MNCKDIKEKMWDYLSNHNVPQEFKEHLAHCPACSAEFEQLQHLIQTLKPKVKACASDHFTNNIIKKINREDQKMKTKIPFYLKVAAVAMLLLTTSLFLMFFNVDSKYQASATPAGRILAESIVALSQSKSMRIEMKIRTLKGDNFELIGADYGFVKHHIKVEFSTPKKWSIEKPGRTVICDGTNQYLKMQSVDYIIKGAINAGFVQWLNILLTPEKILEIEKERSEKNESNYTLKETKDQFILTVYAAAQGDYTNDYLKNKSVWDSDNKRIFYFDKNTHKLQLFELYIIKDEKEILMMKTTAIKYDEIFDAKDFDVQIFGNTEIKNAEELIPKADENLKTKTPEEITRYFFETCATNDWENAEKVFPYIDSKVKEYLGGLEIMEIGKAFKSGKYSGYFVPYTIKLKSGHTKKHNLAIRNDNSEKMWTVDGGI